MKENCKFEVNETHNTELVFLPEKDNYVQFSLIFQICKKLLHPSSTRFEVGQEF